MILVVLISSVFVACSSGPLTEKDNNTTVEYALDTPFQIRLKGSASDGDSWKLVSDNKPSIVLNSTNTSEEANEAFQTFDFTVKGIGEETIRLVYPNEQEPQRQFEIKVICGTMGRILSD